MNKSDKDIVYNMMKEFYSSPAVSTNGSDEIFNTDIKYSIEDNPYLEGYVVEYNNKVIAYTMLAKSFSTEFGKPCIWIEDIYIIPEFRGQKLGEKIIAFIDEKYPKHLIRLEAEDDNVRAIKLYEKCGFTRFPYVELKKGDN
jgi:ribosomal protein S18 acetylase RimI-like enzyme